MKNNWSIFVLWLLVSAVLCFGLLAMEQSGCDTRTATSAASGGESDVVDDDRSDDKSSDSDKKDKKDKKEKKDKRDEKDEKDKQDRDERDDGDRTSVDSVITAVTGLRGLPLKNEIEVSYFDRDELQERVEEEFAEEITPEEIEAEEAALKALDLIDERVDLLETLEELYVDQIVGYYDDETKELVLVSDRDELDTMNELTLSHEVTHALQDQAFNLNTFYPLEGPATEDANAARLALVEGDASLIMSEYAEAELSLTDLFNLGLTAGGELSSMDDVPPYLEESLMFPYLDGEEFVGYMREEGGWDLVDEIYAYPPESTEQILHPEKYIEGDHPVYIEIPDLLPLAGPAWELVYDDSFGEFDVRQLLWNGLIFSEAVEGAAGWGGGRYNFYERSDGAGMAVILLTWDNKLEADEFTLAMQENLEYTYSSPFEFEDWQFPILDSGDGDYWVMVTKGTSVLVARVPDKTLANQLPVALLGAEPPAPDIFADMPPGSMLTLVQ